MSARRVALLILSLAGVAALVACATPAAQPESEYRVIDQLDIELATDRLPQDDQAFRREFGDGGISGYITDTGAWSIEGVVNHTRLLCGIYEMGIQVGRGAAGCSKVEWYSDVKYRTRERQCNSASLIHSGGGSLALTREQVLGATCVRVQLRCAGSCG